MNPHSLRFRTPGPIAHYSTATMPHWTATSSLFKFYLLIVTSSAVHVFAEVRNSPNGRSSLTVLPLG
jgi:hypothetical protein